MPKILQITEDQLKQINENKNNIVVGFHGSNTKFDKFDVNTLGTGNDEDGPGFYFFKDFDNAKNYGTYVYECRLDLNKVISQTNPPNMDHLKILLQNVDNEDLETIVSNYGYEEVNEFSVEDVANIIGDSASDELDAFLEVWIQGYVRNKNHIKTETDYCNLLSKLGYGGYAKDKNGIRYIVVNVNNIDIVKIHQIKGE